MTTFEPLGSDPFAPIAQIVDEAQAIATGFAADELRKAQAALSEDEIEEATCALARAAEFMMRGAMSDWCSPRATQRATRDLGMVSRIAAVLAGFAETYG